MGHSRMRRGEAALLIGIAVYAIIVFLPWTHDVTVAGVGLIAWLMYGLVFAAPLAALILALRTRDED